MAPLRVKTRPANNKKSLPIQPDLPEILADDSFRDVINKLSYFIADAVTLPSTFEQLRTTGAGERLRALVTHLSVTCENPCIVNALLALKWHYDAINDDRGISESRANACEIVAWRFLTHLSEREAVDFCLYEIPDTKQIPGGVATASAANVAGRQRHSDEEAGQSDRSGQAAVANSSNDANENSPLLSRMWSRATSSQARDQAAARRAAGSRRNQLNNSISRLTMGVSSHGDGEGHGDDCDDDDDDPTAPFVMLNALEIAAVADAKRFLSQNVVQKIITGIWNGDIIFWDRLDINAVKKPRFYNPHTADPFSRLRVPKYLKSFEIVYFLSFLAVFYLTLWDNNSDHISPIEAVFYVFLAAFTYDELSEWIDAGSLFYVYDFWNVFDLIMIVIGFIYVILRIVGLSIGDAQLVDLAFNILALEALFMVPRICSILSLSPYWGTMIPCFKEMTKDFIKFMVLVVIIYLGFLTTFSLLGHDVFTFQGMSMILTKIFYGSSYIGFDIMDDIDPILGPPLMIIFISLSTFLLMGSLTGMLSNSFSRVMDHAREEYLYVYSVYVLEASTSNRLTHFYPPFNLLALVVFRPARLFLPSDNNFRAARIVMLKVTHLPIVAVIQFYEFIKGKTQYTGNEYSAIQGPRLQTPLVARPANYGSGSSGVSPSKKTSSGRSPLGQEQVDSPYHDDPLAASTSSLISPTQAGTLSLGASTVALDAVDDEDSGIDAPSDMEVRVAELSAKIDRLTELILQMQMQNAAKE